MAILEDFYAAQQSQYASPLPAQAPQGVGFAASGAQSGSVSGNAGGAVITFAVVIVLMFVLWHAVE